MYFCVVAKTKFVSDVWRVTFYLVTWHHSQKNRYCFFGIRGTDISSSRNKDIIHLQKTVTNCWLEKRCLNNYRILIFSTMIAMLWQWMHWKSVGLQSHCQQRVELQFSSPLLRMCYINCLLFRVSFLITWLAINRSLKN